MRGSLAILVPPREFETEYVNFRQFRTDPLNATSSQVMGQFRSRLVPVRIGRPWPVSGRFSVPRHANGTPQAAMLGV